MPCQWMPVGSERLLTRRTITVSPTFRMNVGAGMCQPSSGDPKVSACAMIGAVLPRSTVASSATSVTSVTVGLGSVSITDASGVTYALPLDVACDVECVPISETKRATAVAATSMRKRRELRRTCFSLVMPAQPPGWGAPRRSYHLQPPLHRSGEKQTLFVSRFQRGAVHGSAQVSAPALVALA